MYFNCRIKVRRFDTDIAFPFQLSRTYINQIYTPIFHNLPAGNSILLSTSILLLSTRINIIKKKNRKSIHILINFIKVHDVSQLHCSLFSFVKRIHIDICTQNTFFLLRVTQLITSRVCYITADLILSLVAR